MWPPEVTELLTGVILPGTFGLSAVALILTSFARGWIVSKFTVETLLAVQNLRIAEAIKRGDDYKAAWELSEKRGDILQTLVDKLTVVGTSVDKILSNLPPHEAGSATKADRPSLDSEAPK